MDTNNELLASIIVKNGQWISDNAMMLWRTQWASAASAAQNEKEQAEYERIAESVRYSFSQNGSSVSLKEQQKEESPFQAVIENGMDAPFSGGQSGTVTEPDGSTRLSKVPHQLWGTELPEYAKESNPVSEGIQTMLNDLVPGWVEETVEGSKTEIAESLKNYIAQELQTMLN